VGVVGLAVTWVEPLRRRRVSAYVAGPGVDDALEVGRRLAAGGLPCVVGYTAPAAEPARSVADTHLAAFERLAAEGLDGEVSVKLSALRFDSGLLAELSAAAARAGRALHVDALGPETVDDTWALLERLEDRDPVGTTLPGRWRRSVDDARRAVELGLRVRVVKGQWSDTAEPDVDPADGMLRVVDRLRDSTRRVAVATHDVPLLAEALSRLRAAEVPCAVELFLGLPFAAPLRLACRLGVPVRVYVPYGAGGAPYGAAALTRNPAATWWLLQDVILGKEKTWRSISRAHLSR
jgi:proline dehydrogenase